MSWLTPLRRHGELKKRGYDVLDLENLFENFFNNDTGFPAWHPKLNQLKVDIKENPKEYIVEAEVPGVNKEDIIIDLDDDRLTIAIEHKQEINEEKENYIRRERKFGSMSRSFAISNIDEANVTAKFENGLLTLVLPKHEIADDKKKRIQID